MRSKWQIWDFFPSFPKGGWSQLRGPVVMQAFDPLALSLMKEHLVYGLSELERPKRVSGPELKPDWVENEFFSLGFFGNDTSYIVNLPEEIPVASKEMLLRPEMDLGSRALVFATQSETPFIKKLLKAGAGLVQIEAPRFWETGKLLDFLCGFHQLPLSYEAKQYLLQAVEPEFTPLFDACRLIKLNHSDATEVALSQVMALVSSDRLDQFALATEMGKKAWWPFFERLLAVETDYDRLRQVFSFLQGHLLRLADPSYLKDKARLSNYDKEIQALAKSWRPQDVRDFLVRLQTWEIAAKKADPLLLAHLRVARLKVLRGEQR